MNVGKEYYDKIPIPEDLDQIIRSSMKRAAREKRTRYLRRWAVSIAAVCCIAFLGANITPVYAYASRLSIIGSVVRMLRIGGGGERTDGVHTKAEANGETVKLCFESSRGELDTAPAYTVSHLLAPNRIVLTLHGVRTLDYETIQGSLLATEAVRDVYRTMIGDDSMYGFTIVLNSGYTYEITELAEPGALSMRFYPDPAYQPEQTVYYLRSEAVPYGEQLGLLSERYKGEATQLRTQSGEYIITIGQYETETEANAALQSIEALYGSDIKLVVESGLADEIPEK